MGRPCLSRWRCRCWRRGWGHWSLPTMSRRSQTMQWLRRRWRGTLSSGGRYSTTQGSAPSSRRCAARLCARAASARSAPPGVRRWPSASPGWTRSSKASRARRRMELHQAHSTTWRARCPAGSAPTSCCASGGSGRPIWPTFTARMGSHCYIGRRSTPRRPPLHQAGRPTNAAYPPRSPPRPRWRLPSTHWRLSWGWDHSARCGRRGTERAQAISRTCSSPPRLGCARRRWKD
mmetsp:Transcript_9578/g.31843  ORF Transcript_9578/g.31843 Transcript_9578/m.31843 type:complete len:233 (-) Transcript_9578:390-1088(-)